MKIKSKVLFIVLLLAVLMTAIAYYFIRYAGVGTCPLVFNTDYPEIEILKQETQVKSINEAFLLLKNRKDNESLAIFEAILTKEPDNLDALWGKAEVLRRARNYEQSQELLDRILGRNSRHNSALISLAYIRYKDDFLEEALRLVNEVLEDKYVDRENKALAYMMLGTINSRRAKKGWFFSKIKYGTSIKCYFLKAAELAGDLPEVHLGLGTFYLFAPSLLGGDLNKAISELELTVKIAPDFATANARLAQAYKKRGIEDKYEFYLNRAKKLDPENEVLKEIISPQ